MPTILSVPIVPFELNADNDGRRTAKFLADLLRNMPSEFRELLMDGVVIDLKQNNKLLNELRGKMVIGWWFVLSRPMFQRDAGQISY